MNDKNTQKRGVATDSALAACSAYPWHKRARWRKALNGWACYQLSSWVALIFPEEADRAMYKTLKDQFEEPNVTGEPEGATK